jgi:hypothetical protein
MKDEVFSTESSSLVLGFLLYALYFLLAILKMKLGNIKLVMNSLSIGLLAMPGVTTAEPCDDPTKVEGNSWNLVAFSGVDGTAFDGDTDLDPGRSYGNPTEDPGCTTPDFQINYEHLINHNDDGNQILFITGNEEYSARAELNDILRTQKSVYKADLGMDICKQGVVETSITGSLLKRDGRVEDPMIGIAAGNMNLAYHQKLIIWAEGSVKSYQHNYLKENNCGVKVYVSGDPSAAAEPFWFIEKASTSATVSSVPDLFQVEMYFSAAYTTGEEIGLRMTLLKSDCKTVLIGDALTSQPVLNMTPDTSRSGYKNIQATFDISKSELEKSDIWELGYDTETGMAAICTRLELMSDATGNDTATSMTFLDTVIQVEVDFTTDFTTNGIVATAADRAAQDNLESDTLGEGATIHTCHCDGSSNVCYTADVAPALSQGDVLSICLTLPNDTELSMISSLTLTQRDMDDDDKTAGFAFAAITSGVENVGTLVVGSEGQNIVMQVTMVSPFYLTQSVPQAVDAAGEVILKLAGGAQARRRLAIIGTAQAGNAKNVEMASAQTVEDGSSFEVEVQLSQIKNESQDRSAAFRSVHSDTAMMGFVLSTILWMVMVAAT